MKSTAFEASAAGPAPRARILLTLMLLLMMPLLVSAGATGRSTPPRTHQGPNAPSNTAICTDCPGDGGGGGNTAPTVSITAPAANSTLVVNTPVTIVAHAVDAEDDITTVDFYKGLSLIGTATTGSSGNYSITYSFPATGSFNLKAKATDDLGNVTTSALVPVTVAGSAPGNVAPTVQMTAPAAGSSVQVNTPVTLSASATDSDGSISKVEFYKGTSLLGTATSGSSGSYSISYTFAATGSVNLKAKAFDNAGASTTSAVINITVASAPPPPPPPPPPSGSTPDPISDAVGATPGTFSVSQNGSATYSLPINATPGTAGVTPHMSLNYDSQSAGDPLLGKGWSIGGTSAIQRCRASREAGDFIVNGQPVDGQTRQIHFDDKDRFCLDGQRLVPAPASAAACAAVAGMTVAQYRTEIDSFQRICAYTADATIGPRFFTVERKDGSTSWYGDRSTTTGGATGPRTDGVLLSTNLTFFPNRVLTWAQVRFQDSTGNYIDYLYWLHPGDGTTPAGEQVLLEAQYTGKVVLPGQAGSALAPYAKIIFNYGAETYEEQRGAYLAGSLYWHTRNLASISVVNNGGTVRQYKIARQRAPWPASGDVVTSIQECGGANLTTCLPATRFDMTTATHNLGAIELPSDINIGNYDKFEGYKLADVDGDGRQDFVWLSDGNSGEQCSTEYVNVAFGSIDATTGANTFSQAAQYKICTPAEEMSDRNDAKGMQRWYLFDYDGDGKADILMSGQDDTTHYWKLYPSLGRPANASSKVFNDANNLLASIPIWGTPDLNLGDFNGDGLIDVIYTYGGWRSSDGAFKYRLMERVAGGFAWGAQRELAPFVIPGLTPDGNARLGSTYSSTGGFQLTDMDGDGRSDLVLELHTGNAGSGIDHNDWLCLYYSYTDDAGNIQFSMTDAIQTGYTFNDGTKVYYERNHRFADLNGDGLTDMVYSGGGANFNDWYFRLSNGFKRTGPTVQSGYIGWFNTDQEKYIQLSDLNGDGTADFIAPSSDMKTFLVDYFWPNRAFYGLTPIPGAPDLIGCSDWSCVGRFSFIFNDFDGDGATDFFSIKWKTSSGDPPEQRLRSARADAGSRFKPRDVITRVTDGLGAVDEVTYLPMTMSDVYRRGTGSRALNWGRGAPVQDLGGAGYVVAKHTRYMPTAAGNAANNTYYRYYGARAQGGGRGYLGFQQVEAIDANTAGKTIVSKTVFNQAFPLTGTVASTQTAVTSVGYTPSPCLTVVTDSCFQNQAVPFTSLGGTVVANETQTWEPKTPFAPGVQQSLAIAQTAAVADTFDLASGTRSARIQTTRTMDAWGNALTETVDAFTGAANTNPIRSATTNTWTNDEAKWRLSRLTAASVTHSRPGATDVTRSTSYAYDMSGAATGFLNVERTQPNGAANEDLRTEYTLDAYGNRIASFTCSQNIANCKNTGVVVTAANSVTTVHRYAKQEYDSIGRYPTRTIETFRKQGTAWGTGDREEVATATVLSRDAFGNVTQAQDVNGAVTMASAGALGRNYWTWSQSVAGATAGDAAGGIDSYHVYRYCGTAANQVSCPVGATAREKVTTDGAPSRWTYIDARARPILVVSETANAGVAGKEFSGVCTWYDVNGRKEAISEPFFLGSTSGEPLVNSNPCAQASRDVTYTLYDVLGRPTKMIAPDPAGTAETNITYTGLSATTTNAKGQTRTEAKNAKGELVSVTDGVGLQTTYAYEAAGNLASVTRSAGTGRGSIVTSMTYDRLGRKVSMTDPDGGTRTYAYTPAGEVSSQAQGAATTYNQYDFRGRLIYQQTASGAQTPEEWVTKHYDLGANARGQLVSSSTAGTYMAWAADKALSKSDTNSYDTLGRLLTTATTIDGQQFQTVLSYDALGRPFKRQDASGKWAKTEFNARGFAVRTCESTSADTTPGCVSGNANTYLETLEVDARGNVTQDKRGGSAAMITQRTYDPFTGRLTKICTGSGGTNCQIVNEQYGWDKVGNLTFRDKATYKEEFGYDANNRLTNAYFRRLGGTSYTDASRPVSYWADYDKLGNICGKSVSGGSIGHAFRYHGRSGCGLSPTGGMADADMTSSPHQVMEDLNAGIVYAYDTDGNQISATSTATPAINRYVRYTMTDKPYEFAKGSQASPTETARFWYDADGPMYKREDFAPATGLKKTLYVGNVEIITVGGVTTTKRYIAGVAVQDITASTTTTRYMHSDHLGNVVAITNAAGGIEEQLDYAATGERRDFANPNQAYTSSGSANTNHGFTGHEMVDGFTIVHMRGRIYDPATGRFMQVDPIIQDPANPQNYNRYTYVWNNPLAYTDPTGMASVRQQLRALAGALISAYLPGSTAIWGGAANGILANAASGFLGSYVSTGNVKSGLAGAFSAGVGAAVQNSAPAESSFGQGDEKYTLTVINPYARESDRSGGVHLSGTGEVALPAEYADKVRECARPICYIAADPQFATKIRDVVMATPEALDNVLRAANLGYHLTIIETHNLGLVWSGNVLDGNTSTQFFLFANPNMTVEYEKYGVKYRIPLPEVLVHETGHFAATAVRGHIAQPGEERRLEEADRVNRETERFQLLSPPQPGRRNHSDGIMVCTNGQTSC